ncbi:unnamed protein product [Hyaloperonospora brassicae]|uniref:Uncharacterized protein n=1 Tax=Hyaloperonospora brassicae TaxID=162125 RepID=A0AAV0TCL4_HYABA|nr:unnamed protein product [Hyaloperonospora brassicae]
MADAMKKDADALDRVLFRLASVDDERMLQVLQSLLPQLLALYPRSTATPLEQQLKEKVLRAVAHIKTRLGALTRPALPLDALCQILQQSELSVVSQNLALLFLEMGFDAASTEQQTRVLAAVVKIVSRLSASQQEALFRLFVRALPVTASVVFPSTEATAGSQREQQEEETTSKSDVTDHVNERTDANVNVMLDFILDLVLYELPYSTSTNGTTVFGLTTPRFARLQRVKISQFDREVLYKAQFDALKFVKEMTVPTRCKLPVYVAGSASFHHAVKDFSNEQLSRVIKFEEKELEDADAVRHLMALVLGSQVAQSSRTMEAADTIMLTDRTRLADASILQTLTLLLASTTATNVQPQMLQLLCHLMFGTEPTRPVGVASKIKLASVQLCQRTFHRCQLSLLEGLLGPVLYPSLLRLLMNTDLEASDAGCLLEFRQGVYESMSVLASRAPAVVATSEQAFQVLLVRCFVEEEHRTGAGPHALKAFTSLAGAYTVGATREVQVKVIQELVAVLKSSKLYDSSKDYVRVRRAIAAWCAELLSASVPEQYDVTLRFAVLRLEAFHDEETRRFINKALFSEPLPSAAALVQTLQSTFTQKDLKMSIHDLGAESCVRFCVEVLRIYQDSSSQDERNCVVEYITHTLFGQSEQSDSTDIRSRSVFETAATALMDLCKFDAESVSAVLVCRVKELFDVGVVSQDRIFLSNIAAIVMYTIRAGALTVSQIVSDFIVAGMDRLDSCSVVEKQLPGVVYILGSVLSSVDYDSVVDAASEDELLQMLLCFRKMGDLLHCKVQEGSIFALHPISEVAQNEQMLRSLMDGIGLSGTLKSFMRSSVGAEWGLLKARALQDLSRVVGWKLNGVHSDDRLGLKLVAVKKISIENLGRSVSGLPNIQCADLLSGVRDALDALFDLDVETDVELQFHVGEALVALGTHDVEEDFAVGHQAKCAVVAANRAVAIFERVVADYAESRQPKKRRIAAVWLLCMCAAGLTTSSRKDESTVVYATSWAGVFRSPAYSHSILSVHEFFVTMLNDASEVSKECAVKGLAYLRLHSPTDEMGAQFSESLFRRLRCFRAFVSTSDAVDAAESGGQVANHEGVGDRSTAAIPPSSSSSVIENAAYREVSNVAADVGDPELMYALLYLSTNDPIWESLAISSASRPVMRSDVFSFVTTDKKLRASIVEKAGTQWMVEDHSSKTKLAPWLYLLKFHPHSKVAAVMNNLWECAMGNSASIATAKGEKTLIRQRWALFFCFALGRLENDRNFKYRVAACLALVDLLNGAEADNVSDNFLRLWVCASRAVDDVVEAVALAGVKLYRYLGEMSLRIAVSDAACSSLLVKFLVEDGIVSKNSVCRALSIDVLIRLVKTLKACDIQDRLAPLLLKLLEYLSSLEMPELQYAQFHVEKKDQLERLRVSISQAGPVGQLLDLATVRLKELAGSTGCVTVVDELARGVANLLKFGVGLNTRVGTANFVITLAGELPFELRKCNGAELLLRRVLIPYVGMKTAAENDQYGDEESRYGGTSSSASMEEEDSSLAATSGLADGLVIQSYCRAAAYLCPLVDTGTVRDYVRRGIFACSTSSESGSKTSRSSGFETRSDVEMEDCGETEGAQLKSHQVFTSRFLLISALAMKELVKKVPPIADVDTVVINDMRNTWYCTHAFPAAFIGQFAAADALKSSWKGVLDELPPTVLYSLRSLDAALQAIALLLAHPAWDTRRQAARALQAIFASATHRSKLSVEQIDRIWRGLLDAVPGRLWTGKGVILESIISLAAVKMANKATDVDSKWTEKLSLLLIEECARAWKNQDLAYLESGIVNLGKFSALLPPEQSDLRHSNVRSLRSMFAGWMTGHEMESSESSSLSFPPMLIKCVFEALSLMWPSLTAAQRTASTGDAETSIETMLWLCANVESPHLAAWSVRKAIFQTLAVVAERAPLEALAGSNGVVERIVDNCCGPFGVADGKYSMVRVAAAGALVALLKRAAGTPDLALRLVVQRERVSTAVQTLLASEEASEQQAAYSLKSQVLLMP